MPNSDPIYVTRPFIPPLSEYQALLEEVWASNILTNNGSMTQRLEAGLTATLGCASFIAVNNGTTAIQLAIKALELRGEIITTPFTWIAVVPLFTATKLAHPSVAVKSASSLWVIEPLLVRILDAQTSSSNA